jgi:transcriptional regulator with XRE-family HTH domain
MSLHINSLLRTQRRSWGLTQKELSRLLGIGSCSHLSRLENGWRPPNLRIAIASYVIFGVNLRKMFPKFWDETEQRVMRRMYLFYQVAQHGTTSRAKRKRDLAEHALRRATSGLNLEDTTNTKTQ